MKYKRIPDGDRFKIVDRGEFGAANIVTSNLSEDELMINALEAIDCPIGTECIKLIDGPKDKVTSICKYYDHPPPETSIGVNVVSCWHGDPPSTKKGKLLNAKGCCGYQAKCASCDDPETFIVPNDENPTKSHAFLVCKHTR